VKSTVRRTCTAGAVVAGAGVLLAASAAALGGLGAPGSARSAVVTHPAALVGAAVGSTRPAPGSGVAYGPRGTRPPSPSGGGAAAGSGQPPQQSALTPAQLLAGVGPVPPGWAAEVHTLVAGGRDRTYLTLEPDDPDGPLPVVVLLHGRNMSPDGILHASELADQVGPAVLVVPAGWDEQWNAGDCCGAAYLDDVDDVGFIEQAVGAVLTSTPHASRSEVFAVGFSNGGRLVYRLACDLPGTFAGVMAVEAVPVETCPSMRPVDMTIVAQDDDPLLTVSAAGRPKSVGGFVEPTVAATVAHMQDLDHCRPDPTVAASGQAVEQTWSCADGTRLRYVSYPGGAHTWRPSTPGTPGATELVRQLLGSSL